MRSGINQYLADAEALAGYNADPTGQVFENLLRLDGGDGDDDEEDLGDKVTEDVDVDIEGPFENMKEIVPDVTGGIVEKTEAAGIGAEALTAAWDAILNHPALIVDTEAMSEDELQPILRRAMVLR